MGNAIQDLEKAMAQELRAGESLDQMIAEEMQKAGEPAADPLEKGVARSSDTDAMEAALRALLAKDPAPADAKVHALAEKLDFETDDLEATAYRMLGEAEKQAPGKHRDTPAKAFDAKQLAMGIKVEREHVNDRKVAEQIAKDHLVEVPDYYTRLRQMEKDAKVNKSVGDVLGDWLRKAQQQLGLFSGGGVRGAERPGHKYIKREGSPGKYEYTYPEESKGSPKAPEEQPKPAEEPHAIDPERVKTARAMGEAAFAGGIGSAPVLDVAFMQWMPADRPVGHPRSTAEMRAWIDGWTTANLRAPVEEPSLVVPPRKPVTRAEPGEIPVTRFTIGGEGTKSKQEADRVDESLWNRHPAFGVAGGPDQVTLSDKGLNLTARVSAGTDDRGVNALRWMAAPGPHFVEQEEGTHVKATAFGKDLGRQEVLRPLIARGLAELDVDPNRRERAYKLTSKGKQALADVDRERDLLVQRIEQAHTEELVRPKPEPLAPAGPRPVEDDIPRSVAQGAFSGTSHVPDERGAQVRKEYADSIQQFEESLQPYVKDPETEARVKATVAEYREGLKKRYLAWLHSHSRVMSAMVTGPSNFPTERNRKRGDVADRRSKELTEWQQQFRGRAHKELSGRGPITADQPDAVVKLQQQLDAAEKRQVQMKAANKVIQTKALSPDEKVTKLVALGLPASVSKELLEPDFAGRLGFPSYELTNNNANIKRMKARIQSITKEQARPTGEVKFSMPSGEEGALVDNADENRVELHFDAKPSATVIQKLKSSGFKWSPTKGVWQRLRNNAARYAAQQITGAKLAEPEMAKSLDDWLQKAEGEMSDLQKATGGEMPGHKYLRRTGSPGNYRYEYQEFPKEAHKVLSLEVHQDTGREALARRAKVHEQESRGEFAHVSPAEVARFGAEKAKKLEQARSAAYWGKHTALDRATDAAAAEAKLREKAKGQGVSTDDIELDDTEADLDQMGATAKEREYLMEWKAHRSKQHAAVSEYQQHHRALEGLESEVPAGGDIRKVTPSLFKSENLEDWLQKAEGEMSDLQKATGGEVAGHKYIERHGTPGAYTYVYAAQNRPVGYATVPKGHTKVEPHPASRHGAVHYDRPLTEDEVRQYELKPIASPEGVGHLAQKVSDEMGYPKETLDLHKEDPKAVHAMIGWAMDRMNAHVGSREAFTEKVLDHLIDRHVADEKAKQAANLQRKPEPIEHETPASYFDRLDAWKEQGAWVPASGGKEEPFTTRTGHRLQYVYQPLTGKHAYHDLGSDVILTDEEAQNILGKGETMGIGDWLQKAGGGGHKYIKREGAPGHYRYTYKEGDRIQIKPADEVRSDWHHKTGTVDKVTPVGLWAKWDTGEEHYIAPEHVEHKGEAAKPEEIPHGKGFGKLASGKKLHSPSKDLLAKVKSIDFEPGYSKLASDHADAEGKDFSPDEHIQAGKLHEERAADVRRGETPGSKAKARAHILVAQAHRQAAQMKLGKSLPAENLVEGLMKSDLTPAKARKILHDGEVQGHPLTDQQRKYFGAVASGTARKGGDEEFTMKKKSKKAQKGIITTPMAKSLEDWMQKSEGMPTGEPGMIKDNGARKPQEGADLEAIHGGNPPVDTNRTSRTSPDIGDAPRPAEKAPLSEDDMIAAEAERLLARPMEKSCASVESAIEEARFNRDSAMRKAAMQAYAADTVTHAGPIERPRPQPETLQKSRTWTQGPDSRAVYTDRADRECYELLKGDQFYADGSTPGVLQKARLFQKDLCKSCNELKPVYLTACPHCGDGSVQNRVTPPQNGGQILEKSQDGRTHFEMTEEEPDLYLPEGVKLS